MNLVHVLSRLHNAGPARSLLAYTRELQAMGERYSSTLVVLTPSVHPAMLLQAKRLGCRVVVQPMEQVRDPILSEADLVVVHYWNAPAMNEFLHGAMPPCRLVIWYRVYGEHAPHVITPFQLDRADAVLATSTGSLELPVFEDHSENRAFFMPGIADAGWLKDLEPISHPGFNVTYIGTVNPAKMHPRFIEMSERINVPGIRIVVCGADEGGLVERMRRSPRFELRGFVDAVDDVLAVSDVLGYPLCPETYATSEQSVQESMWAGVPPIAFPYGGLAALIKHGETGLLVHSEDEYVDAVEYLSNRPDERRRLGANARRYARERFDLRLHAQRLSRVYSDLSGLPKTAKEATTRGPVERFYASLDAATAFRLQVAARPPGERELGFSYLMIHGEGGIMHYRNSYPDAPEFRLWTALALRDRDARAALAELQAASAAGLDVAWLESAMREATDPAGA